jgi:hypothetical protein
MAGERPQEPPQGQILIYQDGGLNLQVRLDGQTVWLPQRLIAELFQVSVKTANEHLVNIYNEGELDREATIRSFRIVQREGSRAVVTAQDQARRKKPIHVAEWVDKLDAFLQFNERNILTHASTVSHQLAEEHAHAELARYDEQRRHLEAAQPLSEFDSAVEEVKQLDQAAPSREPKKPARKKKGDNQ